MTEVGGVWRLGNANQSSARLEAGLMCNLTDEVAIGASAFAGSPFSDDEDGYTGLRLRLRRWLTPSLSFELGPGFAAPTWSPARFTTDLSLNFGDDLTLALTYEPNKHGPSWGAGVRAGSFTAIAIFGGLLLLGALVASGNSGVGIGP